MSFLKDLRTLNFLPAETSKSRIFYSLFMYKESILSFIIDKVIFVLNVLSLIVVLLENKASYTGLHNDTNWIAILDLCVFIAFCAIFAIKICTCHSQTVLELGLKPNSIFKNAPITIKKIFAFLSIKTQFTELIILIIYSLVFYPVFTPRSFRIILYISFYSRCVKMAIYSFAGRIFFRILFKARALLLELGFLVTLLVIILGFSAYWAETNITERRGSLPFNTVSDGIWWAIVTITTTGYGDYYTVSAVGKIISSVAMIIGFLYFVMPLCIINNVFQQYMVEQECLRENWHTDIKDKIKRSKIKRGESRVPNFPREGNKKAETPKILNQLPEANNSSELWDWNENESYRFGYLKSKLNNIELMIKRQDELIEGLRDFRAFVIFLMKKEKKRILIEKTPLIQKKPNIESIFKTDDKK